jgi:type IV pilus assembly protein PilA
MQDIINGLRAKKDDEGFTLIELLVVVVIIGVLVAIAVPLYLNYRQGSADKAAQSDVRGAVSTVELWYGNSGNTYPTTPTGVVKNASFTITGAGSTTGLISLSDHTTMVYVAPSGATTTYRVCATNSDGSGKYYLYDSASGGSVAAVATITTPTLFASCGP